jgi:hypothetical protein
MWITVVPGFQKWQQTAKKRSGGDDWLLEYRVLLRGVRETLNIATNCTPAYRYR